MPEAAPSEVAWPSRSRSRSSQPSGRGAGGDHAWSTQTTAAASLAPSAEPALKPNQPNHSRPAPSMTSVRLCGRIGSRFQPTRLPSTSARARPAAPALMSTAVPPAKSIAPSWLASQPPVVGTGGAVEGEDPVRDRGVDDAWPRAGEHHPGAEAGAVGDRAGDEGAGDDREEGLEADERQARDRGDQATVSPISSSRPK